VIRRHGALERLVDFPQLDNESLREVLEQVTAQHPDRGIDFSQRSELDLAYTPPGLPRIRVNGFRERGAMSFAFRVIPATVPSFPELGLPAGVRRLADEVQGLILITGTTGSGKTTTLAAMLDHINRTRSQHIVTIEDPIEIVHADLNCIVRQREVGIDTASYSDALRRALRQDPDVLVIGELRDSEAAQTALNAAESGHLVLTTPPPIAPAPTIH